MNYSAVSRRMLFVALPYAAALFFGKPPDNASAYKILANLSLLSRDSISTRNNKLTPEEARLDG